MTRDEYNIMTGDVMTEISAETLDKGKISEMLANLREGFNLEVTSREAAEAEQQKLKTANESLQAANMALFLKSGEVIKQAEEIKAPKAPLSFDALFDENGELK